MKFYILLTLLVLIRDVINWSIFYQVCRNEFKELYDYLPTYRQYQLLEIKNNYDKTNNKEKNIRKKDKPNIKQNNKEDEQINLLFQEYFKAVSLCVTEAYNNYMKNVISYNKNTWSNNLFTHISFLHLEKTEINSFPLIQPPELYSFSIDKVYSLHEFNVLSFLKKNSNERKNFQNKNNNKKNNK